MMHYQEMTGQGSRSGRRDRLLAAVEMLIGIANLRLPNERWGHNYRTLEEFRIIYASYLTGIPKEEQAKFFRLLRKKTQVYWPELWAPVAENEPVSKTEERAFYSVVDMRAYLRRFWLACTEGNPRAGDWYIHRAREYYQRHFVITDRERNRGVRQTRETLEKQSTADGARIWASSLNREIEALLDTAPEPNPVEDALFHLQERAQFPSTSPLYCKNPDCETPYFLSDKKGKKYCSTECSQAGTRAIKRQSWSSNKSKWRPK